MRTGIEHLDIVLGVHGLPQGKCIEIFGAESTGKSTFVQSLMREIQWNNPDTQILYFDSEYSFDMLRYKLMGGKEFELIQDNKLENIFKHIAKVTQSAKTPTLIIIDTIASTTVAGGGLQERPKLIRRFLTEYTPVLSGSPVCLIFLNQVYAKIDRYGGLTSAGGYGLRHFVGARFQLKRVSTVYEQVVGAKVMRGLEANLEGIKNKISYERLPCPLFLSNTMGLDQHESILLFLRLSGVLTEKSGGAKEIVDEQLGIEYKWRKRTKFRSLFDENEDLQNYVILKTLEFYSALAPILKIKLKDRYNEYRQKFGLEPIELSEQELVVVNEGEEIEEEKDG